MEELIAWLVEKRGRRMALAKLLNLSPGATRHLKAVSDATLIPLTDLV